MNSNQPAKPQSMVPKTEPSIHAMIDDIRLLIRPQQVMELRALGVRRGRGGPHTEAGFFDTDHLKELVLAAVEVTRFASGVYMSLNPLHPDLLYRRINRMEWAARDELAKAEDVLERRWLLVDIDPVRRSHISATDEEKRKAYETTLAVLEYLRSGSWPEPLLADSGNGYHLLYRIDEPVADGDRIKSIVNALADRFDSQWAKIDRQVFNPAQLCKVPGTLARKGDHTAERPHRRARFLEVPK